MSDEAPSTQSRRQFLGKAALAGTAALTGCSYRKPNILVCISGDQSYPHASAYGCKFVNTPNFDRIAREGVLYTNAFCSSPGCSPSRASLLTGLHPWQLEEAGTHASSFPAEFKTGADNWDDSHRSFGEFTSGLVGYTGKGWGPGRWEDERDRNPAGIEFNQIQTEPDYRGISRIDYAANFEAFLDVPEHPGAWPFLFWFGASEPHRPFEKGVGLASGKKIEDVDVPPFLPDAEEVRSDLLDYAVEIEHFDAHLGRMLDILAKRDELENTVVIVTSDNGMAFPRAKANCYEYGAHVPLAIRGPRGFTGGRVVDGLVSFVDLTDTIYSVAENSYWRRGLPGRSLASPLSWQDQDLQYKARDNTVYFGRERHSSSRYNNLGYPQRAIRTKDYLYIRNFNPDRWPAGDPQKFEDNGTLGPMHGGYHDIDACPTLDYLVEYRDDPAIRPFFLMAVDKRPADELYDIRNDPGCLHNLAGDVAHASARLGLAQKLIDYLGKTGDPRVLGNGDIWETYERYSPIRTFPEPPESL